MNYFVDILNSLLNIFSSLTDRLPFGLIATIVGADNSLNSSFTFYFFYLLGISFGIIFLIVFYKALNIKVLTKVGNSQEQEIKLIDLLSKFIFGRDTMPLFLYKLGYAFSKNSYIFFGFAFLFLLFYIPVQINGQNISTLGQYKNLYYSQIEDSKGKLISFFMKDQSSILTNSDNLLKADSIFDTNFSINNNCSEIINIEESNKCYRENEIYKGLLNKVLIELKGILDTKQNISYSDIILKTNDNFLSKQNLYNSIDKGLEKLKQGTLKKEDYNSLIKGEVALFKDDTSSTNNNLPTTGNSGIIYSSETTSLTTNTQTGNLLKSGSELSGDYVKEIITSGKNLALKAVETKKEMIIQNSILLSLNKGGSFEGLDAFYKVLSKKAEDYNKMKIETKKSNAEVIMDYYEKTKLQPGIDRNVLYFQILEKTNINGVNIGLWDKFIFTLKLTWGIILILFIIIMSGRKSTIILIDFYWREFMKKSKDGNNSFIQKLLMKDSQGEVDLYNPDSWNDDNKEQTRFLLSSEEDTKNMYNSRKMDLSESIGDEIVVMNKWRGIYYILLVIEIFLKLGIIFWLMFGI